MTNCVYKQLETGTKFFMKIFRGTDASVFAIKIPFADKKSEGMCTIREVSPPWYNQSPCLTGLEVPSPHESRGEPTEIVFNTSSMSPRVVDL